MNVRLWLLIILCIVLVGGLSLGRQQKGQYLPWQYGLNSGILPSPGFTYANMELNYSADTVNGTAGNFVAAEPTLKIWVAV